MIAEVIAGYAAAVATASVLFQIWQARASRRPQIELELIHTQFRSSPNDINPFLIVFLEVRNRGNHPIRVVGAGIDSPKVRYDFRPQVTEVTRSGVSLSIPGETSKKDDGADDKAEMLPLPGIILPRDAASRSISNRMIPAEDVTKIKESLKDKLGNEIDDLFIDVDRSFREELYGWVEVSTGEFIHTKHIKHDWDADLKPSDRDT